MNNYSKYSYDDTEKGLFVKLFFIYFFIHGRSTKYGMRKKGGALHMGAHLNRGRYTT